MSETWSRIVSVSSSLILWPSEAHRARSSCEVKGNGLGAVGRSVDVQKAKGGKNGLAARRKARLSVDGAGAVSVVPFKEGASDTLSVRQGLCHLLGPFGLGQVRA